MNNNITIIEAASTKLGAVILELESQNANKNIKNAIEQIKMAQDWLADAAEDLN